MKQKEERDLEFALAHDGKPGNLEDALAAMKIDKEESEQFFKEAGQTVIHCDVTLLDHRRKRVNGNLAKHWFIYENLTHQEVRLLTSDQHINSEKYSFLDAEDKLVFSYK
jgi:hypothetical protein